LIFITVSQDGLDTSYVMWFRDIFSLVTDSEWIGGAAEETRCEIALFLFSHSLMWERCTIHTSFSDAIDPPLWLTKSVPARDGGWDALEAPPAERPGEFAS